MQTTGMVQATPLLIMRKCGAHPESRVYCQAETCNVDRANSGAIGCLEILVNLDEIELDVKNALEGDTPLHKAVQFQTTDVPMAEAMVELLLEGGADPSILNRNKLTPLQLVHPQNTALKELLEQGATSYQMVSQQRMIPGGGLSLFLCRMIRI